MQDLSAKEEGDEISSSDWNAGPTEIQNVITGSGQTLTSADLTQLGQAIASYSANGKGYSISGSSNVYTATTVGDKQSPIAYTEMFEVQGDFSTVNTSTATIDVAGLGATEIKNYDKTDLVGGELDGVVTLYYDSGDSCFYIKSRVEDDTRIVARGLGVTDKEVLSTNNTTKELDDVVYLYNPDTNVTYALPELTTTGETISSIDGNELTTSTAEVYNLTSPSRSDLKLKLSEATTSTDILLGDSLRVSDRSDSLFDVVLASSVTANGYNIISCTGNADYALELRHNNSTEDAGAWGHDGTNLDSIISAIAVYAESLGSRLKVTIDKDSVLSSGLDIDVDYIEINLMKHSLDFSDVSGNAVSITSDVSTRYSNTIAGLKNGIIFASRDSDQVGVYYNTDTTSASSRSFLKDLVIHDFGTGISYVDRAYLIKNYNINIYSCDCCISDTGGSDSGENISFIDSTIANSTLAVEAKNGTGSIQFINTSIDYCGQIFDVDGGVVIFQGGHLEDSNSDRRISITGNGGCVYINNAVIIRAASSTLTDYYSFVDDGCVLSITGGFMTNTESDTGEFYTGDGLCVLQNIQGYNLHGNNKVLGLEASLMSNPTFSELTSEQFITTGGTLSDIHTGTVCSISASDNSLVCSKLTEGNASVAISVPFQKGDQVGFRFSYDNSESSGDVYITPRWALLRDTEGYITIEKLESVHDAFTMTAGATGTKEIAGSSKYRAPAWASHFVLLFNCNTLTTETDFSVSECYITKIG